MPLCRNCLANPRCTQCGGNVRELFIIRGDITHEDMHALQQFLKTHRLIFKR